MRRLLVVLLLIPPILGCAEKRESSSTDPSAISTNQPPPTLEEARTLLASSPEFSEYQFTNAAWSLPLTASMMNEPARVAAKDLAAENWIGFDEEGNVRLQKGATDRRFLVRPNGFVDIVPLARKQIVAVTSVGKGPGGDPIVDFTWKWVPNEIGQAIKSGHLYERYQAEQKARATLLRDGARWTVLKIEPVAA